MDASGSILVVPSSDGDVSAAYAAACRVAPSMSAAVTVLEVLPDRGWPGREVVPMARARAAGTEAPARSNVGGERRLLVRFGDRDDEIRREVREGGHSLVITQVEPGPGHADDALALARSCAVNVWLVRPTSGLRHGVVAIVDPAPEPANLLASIGDPARDRRVLTTADRIAKAFAEPLTVFHAWRAVGETLLQGRGRIPAADIRRYVGQVGTLHSRAVTDLVGNHRFQTGQPVVQLVKEDPAVRLVRHPTLAGARLVVAGIKSKRLLRDTESSVLIVI